MQAVPAQPCASLGTAGSVLCEMLFSTSAGKSEYWHRVTVNTLSVTLNVFYQRTVEAGGDSG